MSFPESLGSSQEFAGESIGSDLQGGSAVISVRQVDAEIAESRTEWKRQEQSFALVPKKLWGPLCIRICAPARRIRLRKGILGIHESLWVKKPMPASEVGGRMVNIEIFAPNYHGFTCRAVEGLTGSSTVQR
jgi:hypothetical protein